MGFFKKLLGTAAFMGAAVGGTLYVKNRKDSREQSSDFEDFDNQKIFDVKKDTDKVTVVFNSKKAKNVADKAADKVIDATDNMKNTVSDKLGEENIEKIKKTVDSAKEKINSATDTATTKAKEAQEVVVEKIGEENIRNAKAKVLDAVDEAKDAINDKVNKYVKPIVSSTENTSDFVEEEDISSHIVENVATSNEDISHENNPSDMITDELDDLADELEEIVEATTTLAGDIQTEDDVTLEEDLLDNELEEL